MKSTTHEIHASLTRYLQRHRRRFDAVLFDVDGTLVRGGDALPGVPELLAALRVWRLPFVLLTNDGNHSTIEKARLLRRAGIPVAPSEIVSCADAIADYVAVHRLAGSRAFIMGDLGKPCYARRARLRTTRRLAALPRCAGVIVGESHYEWEPTFNAVLNFFIGKPDAFLLVPNPDVYWPGRRRNIHIGAGGKARFLQLVLEEYGVRVKPEFLGKPNPAIFVRALHHLRRRWPSARVRAGARVLVAGDSLAADIVGARRMGFTAALVLTGITPRGRIETPLDGPARPQLVFERV